MARLAPPLANAALLFTHNLHSQEGVAKIAKVHHIKYHLHNVSLNPPDHVSLAVVVVERLTR